MERSAFVRGLDVLEFAEIELLVASFCSVCLEVDRLLVLNQAIGGNRQFLLTMSSGASFGRLSCLLHFLHFLHFL